MKRFSDSERFDDPWYCDLPVAMKVAWELVRAKCDHAGVWKPNFRLANFQIGEDVDWEKFRELCGDRIKTIPTGWLIVDFVKMQCGELSEDCRAHIPVIKKLREHNLLPPDRLSIDYGMSTHRHMEMEKEQEKETPKGGAGGKDNKPTSPRALLVARLFRRGPNAKWSDKEIASFKKLKDHPDSEFEEVAEFYDKSGYEYLCTGLQAFLNNFTTQLDRARQWKAGRLNGNGSNGHSGNGTHPVKRIQSAAEAYGG